MIAKELSSKQTGKGATAITGTTRSAMMTITGMKITGTTVVLLQTATIAGHLNIALGRIGAESMKGNTHEHDVIVIGDINTIYHFVSILEDNKRPSLLMPCAQKLQLGSKICDKGWSYGCNCWNLYFGFKTASQSKRGVQTHVITQ